MALPPPVRLQRAPSGSLDERTDDELMTLAQAGARSAFAALVERHAERVAQTCARFAQDPDAGADLAQETWVAVWVRRAQYTADGKFPLWLITVARNHCRNHVRGRGVARRHAQAATLLGEAPSPDQIDALLLEERRRHVRAGLARLPGPMREALLLRYAEDLRYDEMVEVVRTGESTLRSRVHHGLKQLRALLEKNR
jgi:RNA polymerase sigma-70 factor (ECF subfamily)